eukprot:6217176-Pyramimonas_sp.AAC.2
MCIRDSRRGGPDSGWSCSDIAPSAGGGLGPALRILDLSYSGSGELLLPPAERLQAAAPNLEELRLGGARPARRNCDGFAGEARTSCSTSSAPRRRSVNSWTLPSSPNATPRSASPRSITTLCAPKPSTNQRVREGPARVATFGHFPLKLP